MSYPSLLPVVHVGAADSGIIDLEEDIIGVRELGYGAVFEEDIFDSAKDERVVFLREGSVQRGESLRNGATGHTLAIVSVAISGL